MELLVNGVATINADLKSEGEDFILSWDIVGSERKDAFMELFSDKGPIILNNGTKDMKLKKTSSSYSNKNNSQHYYVTIHFKEYTKEDEKEENKISLEASLYFENTLNRIRIEGLKKILLKKGIVESSEEFLLSNLFTDKEYDDKMNEFRKDFLDRMGYEDEDKDEEQE